MAAGKNNSRKDQQLPTLAITNSSMFTSSASVMRPVWICIKREGASCQQLLFATSMQRSMQSAEADKTKLPFRTGVAPSQPSAASTRLEDAALGLLVGQRELDFAVDAAGADEGGVQRVDAVCGHDDLYDAQRRAALSAKDSGRTRGIGRAKLRVAMVTCKVEAVVSRHGSLTSDMACRRGLAVNAAAGRTQHSSSTQRNRSSSTHLDIGEGIKAVQLVEQLKHGALDLTLATAVRIVPLGAHGVNLICSAAGRPTGSCS